MATRLLCELIRIDTSNPPGTETAAARYLESELWSSGVGSRVLEPEPGRGSLLARVPANVPAAEAGPPLFLLAHLDTVPADPLRWQYDPFGGVMRDGWVWGRGAIDCKGPAAVFASLLAWLRGRRGPRYRDVALAATADGEFAGRLGLGWLARTHPDELLADAAIAQGGGWPMNVHGQTYYTYQAADKGSVQVRITAYGQAGHGAMPCPRSAIFLLSRALAVLADTELPTHVTPCFQGFVEALARPQSGFARSQIRSLLSPLLTSEAAGHVAEAEVHQSVIAALARNTFCPTAVRAGLQGWVSPDTAEASLDCRVLPGQTPASLKSELEGALLARGLPFAGQDRKWGLEIEARPEVDPSESPPGTELAALMERALRRRLPSAHLVPITSAASSGMRFLRANGTLGYGFFPLLPEVDLTTVHGADERISLRSLQFALQVLGDVIAAYVGAPPR
jgi:acetylornithine deacetylase/succinyl-diaminopimelate desuccinylase-like protein